MTSHHVEENSSLGGERRFFFRKRSRQNFFLKDWKFFLVQLEKKARFEIQMTQEQIFLGPYETKSYFFLKAMLTSVSAFLNRQQNLHFNLTIWVETVKTFDFWV